MRTRPANSVLSILLACLLVMVGSQANAFANAARNQSQQMRAAEVMQIVICSSEGQRIVRLDRDGNPLDGAADSSHEKPCCTDACFDCAMCSSLVGDLATSPAIYAPASSLSAPLPAASTGHSKVRLRSSARAPPRTGR